KPRREWHFDEGKKADEPPKAEPHPVRTDGHAAEAAALGGPATDPIKPEQEVPLTAGRGAPAGRPDGGVAGLRLLTGVVRQEEERREGEEWSLLGVLTQNEGPGPVFLGDLQTNYRLPIPTLHQEVLRDKELHDPAMGPQKPEGALFNFAWLTAPGT